MSEIVCHRPLWFIVWLKPLFRLDSFQPLTENESVKGDDVHQGPKLGTKPRLLLRASLLTNTFDEAS